MTADRDLEHLLDGWFDQHTTTAPSDLLSRTAARIDRVPQRPTLLAVAGTLVAPSAGGRSLALAAVMPLILVAVAIAAVGSEVARPRVPLAATNAGVWAPSDVVAFRAQVDPTVSQRFTWRAGTYADYTLAGWSLGDLERVSVPANRSLAALDSNGAAASTDRQRLQITITPEAFRDRTIVGPAIIETVDQPVDALLTGGWLASIEADALADRYTLSALIRDPSRPGALTERDLRAARGSYPPQVIEAYTTLPAGALGPAATSLLAQIRASVPEASDRGNPYALARGIETYLRDPANFTYATDVRAETEAQCRGVSTVECFAITRRGFCEHYATTMAVLLRAASVPARIVNGFLPGERDEDGVEVVRGSSAHWWVEVYFPGHGWVEFDPTGGGVGQPLVLPAD